jgi:hypothetical protein
MADGILNFSGALVLVGAVLAAALMILWISIRSFSLSGRVEARPRPEEDQGAAIVPGRETSAADGAEASDGGAMLASEP